MNGCSASGKFDEAKNTPERIHIGRMTRLSIPDSPSTVFARLAASRPMPREAEGADDDGRRHQQPRSAHGHVEDETPEREEHAGLDDEEHHAGQDLRQQVLAAPHRGRHEALEQLARARLHD